MSDDTLKNAPPLRKMTRCPEGHVFDAGAHDCCPSCGARVDASGDTRPDQVARPEPRPDPVPRPSWLRPALLAGGGILGLLIIVVLVRGSPDPGVSETTSIASTDSGGADAVRPAQPAPPPAATERWQTVMLIGGRSYVCVNETEPDGRYRLGEGCPAPFAGETGVTTVSADGSWTSRSDAGRLDAGTIEFVNADRFIAHTRGGPVIWDRVKP